MQMGKEKKIKKNTVIISDNDNFELTLALDLIERTTSKFNQSRGEEI